MVVSKKYYYPLCDKVYSCDEQGRVIEAQKLYKRKIVTNEEINKVYSNKVLLSMKKIKKHRWILLFPIIGGIICMFLVFNGELSKKTKSKDGIKLLLSSVLVSVGVALIIKLVCSMFDYIELINTYKNIFMLIPFLLSFNFPILWYINHKLK